MEASHLSFAEFSETLQLCVGLAKGVVILKEEASYWPPNHHKDLESCLNRIGVLDEINGRHASSHHVDRIESLLLNPAMKWIRDECRLTLEIMDHSYVHLRSWHRAAIVICIQLNDKLWHINERMKGCSSTDFDFADIFALLMADDVLWSKIESGLMDERQVVANMDTPEAVARNRHATAAVNPATTESIQYVKLPKAFLRKELGNISDKTLPVALENHGVRLHPDDTLPNQKHKLRVEIDSLINTKIYSEVDRSSKLSEWIRTTKQK